MIFIDTVLLLMQRYGEKVTQGALLRIPADSPGLWLAHIYSEQNIARGLMCPAPARGSREESRGKKI